MSDDVIRSVRTARHKISAECDHDIHRVVALYRAYQEDLKQSGRFRFAVPDSLRKAKGRREATLDS